MAMSTPVETESETLLSFSVSDGLDVTLQADPWALAIAAIVLITILAWRSGAFNKKNTLELNSAQIGFGSGTLVYQVNNSDFQIAYSIWVELATRKLGLPVDFEDDVIVEIYDSWYNFFATTRELIKTIPASKMQNHDTRMIVALSTDILNLAIRPHLTKWQARFRHWYATAIVDEKNKGKSPQEVQVLFPDYENLKTDLQAVNKKITYYEEQLRKLTIG